MAAANHKLTELLKGKTINGTSDSNGKKKVTFGDDSIMTVKVKDSNSNAASTGGTIAKVRQDANVDTPTLHLDMEEGHSLDFALAEPTSSVIVRDKDDDLLYAD